jgi:hypothetical protein
MIVYVLLFSFSVETAIFGYPLLWLFSAKITYDIQYTIGYIMVGFMPFSILTAFAYTAFAYDIQKRTALNRARER